MGPYVYALTASAAETSAEAASGGGTHPVFWVIVAVAAIGLVIMFVQNFVLKKEEYYK